MPGWLPSGAAWGPGLIVAAACAVLGLLAHAFVSRDRDAHFLGPRAAIAGSVFHLAMLGAVFVVAAPKDLLTYWLDVSEGSISMSSRSRSSCSAAFSRSCGLDCPC